MQRKLTITLDDKVYDGLHRVIGRRKISRFIESVVRPHVVEADMDSAYRDMASDVERESEAVQWVEGTLEEFGESR